MNPRPVWPSSWATCWRRRVFFNISGAEANETAIKLARGYFFKKGQPGQDRNSDAIVPWPDLATATATVSPSTVPPLPHCGRLRHIAYNDVRPSRWPSMTSPVLYAGADPGRVRRPSGLHRLCRCSRRRCHRTGARLRIDEIRPESAGPASFLPASSTASSQTSSPCQRGRPVAYRSVVAIANQETATGLHTGDHGAPLVATPWPVPQLSLSSRHWISAT